MVALNRRDLLICAAVALGAALFLLVLAPVYSIHNFYVAGQVIMANDQVGYLTAARWLAETGELRNHIIFPAYVRQPNWRLYMPGQYYVLAAGHLVFGDGPIAWRMPAMLSFLVSAVGVFLIGRRFHGRASGAVAALLFVAFSPITAFAFTAMPQLPFIAVSVTVFCIFAYLPARWRPVLVPLLLTGPFLFRETGAFLVIPMALVMLGDATPHRWRRVLASVAAAVVVLYALLSWQIASGKSSLPFDGSSFNYANAFPSPSPPKTFVTWTTGIGANVARNVDRLEQHYRRFYNVFVPLALMCALAVSAGIRGIKRRSGRGDLLALGASLLCVTVVLVLTVFYTWARYRGLRALLFTFPLLAVSVAPWIVSSLALSARRLGTWFPRPVAYSPTLLFTGMLLWSGYRGNQRLAIGFNETHGARAVEVMESLHLDDSGVLVAPDLLAMDYALRHYPLRWSFIPSNARTLELLNETYEVQTVIVRKDDLGQRLSEKALLGIGLVRTREFEHAVVGYNSTFVVFERRP